MKNAMFFSDKNQSMLFYILCNLLIERNSSYSSHQGDMLGKSIFSPMHLMKGEYF